MAREIKILKKIQKIKKAEDTPCLNSNIPYIHDYGVVILKSSSSPEGVPYFYYILPKY